MTVSILALTASLATVLEDDTYSLACLRAHPLTVGLAPGFVAIQSAWMTVNLKEIALTVSRTAAAAVVSTCNDQLSALIEGLSRDVLVVTRGNRRDPLYLLYFASRLPGELKRLAFHSKRARVRGWISSLKASSSAVLVACGAKLEQQVAAAEAAAKNLAVAEQAIRDFRLVGERRALIDQFNALRKATHGALSKMPHAHPEAQLPNTFADQFFRHDTSRRGAHKALSAAAITAQLEAKEAERAALKGKLTQALAREAEAAKAKAKAEADKQALAEARKAAAEAKAKLAALEAKLGASRA